MKGKGTGGNFQMPYRQDQRQGKDKQNMSNLQIRQHRFSIRENRKGLVHNRMLTHQNFHPPPSRTQVTVAVEGLSSISLRKIAKIYSIYRGNDERKTIVRISAEAF